MASLSRNLLLTLISVGLFGSVIHGASVGVDKIVAPGSIVFLGDSWTSQWGTTGLSVWREYYEPIAINKGQSGFKTTDTIFQIEDGGLDGLNPKVVVLLIGGNDLTAPFPGNYIADNIKIIIEMIQTRLPDAHILLLALLPGDVPSVIIEQGKLVNTLISAYDTSGDGGQHRMIKFLDMGLEFGTSDGEIYRELYDWDGIHLSNAGYQVWANAMGETLMRLLNMN